MNLSRKILSIISCMAALCFGCAQMTTPPQAPVTDIQILQDWQGEYPAAELDQLPEKNCIGPVGYLNNQSQFADIWQHFKPGQTAPQIDFNSHVAIFARNTVFFNRIGIARVILKQGIAEILVMGTLSALPIEDSVCMAMAVIPRKGVFYIKAGSEKIRLVSKPDDLVLNP